MEQLSLSMAKTLLVNPTDPPIGPSNTLPKKAARSKKMLKEMECSVPIEEALRTELATDNMKTPISLLQELLSRRGITPQYDLVQVEGAVHEPSFRYRVSFMDKDAMGTGKSKKEAKHAAAKALIEKLTGSCLTVVHPREHVKQEICDVNNEKEAIGNPIGWLQEMCMARRWPPPAYETVTEKGLPHEREFTMACLVLKQRVVAEGKSKKIAKRQAAQKMWQRLQDQPLESNQPMAPYDEDDDEERVSLYDRGINYAELLDDIAREQGFDVTYVDIDEKTANNEFQCLVQLSTMPVAVCHGSGLTIPEAHAHAARNSLEYLKIMSKYHKK